MSNDLGAQPRCLDCKHKFKKSQSSCKSEQILMRFMDKTFHFVIELQYFLRLVSDSTRAGGNRQCMQLTWQLYTGAKASASKLDSASKGGHNSWRS